MNVKKNIAIFVDYDNIFIAMNQYYRDFTNPMLPYTIIKHIQDKYKNDNIIICNLYADLRNIRISNMGFNILDDCQVNLQHVPQGKNSSDIILLIDVLKNMQAYKHIDKIVIVSSDSDMSPIWKESKLYNKDIEIIYVHATTSLDYIAKLHRAGIMTLSIESLLGLLIADANISVKELFGRITQDANYLQCLLVHINNIIRDIYEKYLREDKYGHVISAGATSLSSLSYHIKDRDLLPDYLTTKYEDYSFFVRMLVECEIIIPISYHYKQQEFTTWVLSPDFLQQYACSIPRLVDQKHFIFA